METIGDRVRRAIKEAGITQVEVARSASLSESQLSKSLKSERQFSAVELAQLSDTLSKSLHWLITGEQDPLSVNIAARHSFDGHSGTYHADGIDSDRETLQSIALLYRQAYA